MEKEEQASQNSYDFSHSQLDGSTYLQSQPSFLDKFKSSLQFILSFAVILIILYYQHTQIRSHQEIIASLTQNNKELFQKNRQIKDQLNKYQNYFDQFRENLENSKAKTQQFTDKISGINFLKDKERLNKLEKSFFKHSNDFKLLTKSLKSQTEQVNNKFENITKQITIFEEYQNSYQLSLEENFKSIDKRFEKINLQLQNKILKIQSLFLDFDKDLKDYIEEQKDHKLAINFLEQFIKKKHYDEKMNYFRSLERSQNILSSDKNKRAWRQSKGNIRLEHIEPMVKKQIQNSAFVQFIRMSNKYNFNSHPQELPFCIVVPTYNNARQFRFEYNLQSILNQVYENYHVVIIDDASTDGTADLIERYLKKKNIDKKRVEVIRNQKKETALVNIHIAITKYCQPTQIVFLVDGDDQLLGNYIFKIYNSAYETMGSDVIYSDHFQMYWHESIVKKGWSLPYTPQQKANNRYRDVPQRIAHLRSFKASLYLKIDEKDLKDKEGKWFINNYDEAICLPLMEMACGKVQYLYEYFYLYNFGIGSNDWLMDPVNQNSTAAYIRTLPKYQCLNSND